MMLRLYISSDLEAIDVSVCLYVQFFKFEILRGQSFKLPAAGEVIYLL